LQSGVAEGLQRLISVSTTRLSQLRFDPAQASNFLDQALKRPVVPEYMLRLLIGLPIWNLHPRPLTLLCTQAVLKSCSLIDRFGSSNLADLKQATSSRRQHQFDYEVTLKRRHELSLPTILRIPRLIARMAPWAISSFIFRTVSRHSGSTCMLLGTRRPRRK
jgi:hypothetical protein